MKKYLNMDWKDMPNIRSVLNIDYFHTYGKMLLDKLESYVMKDIKKWIRPTIFVAGGVIVGVLYNIFIGCSGSCMMGANPVIVIGQTGFMGWIVSKITEK